MTSTSVSFFLLPPRTMLSLRQRLHSLHELHAALCTLMLSQDQTMATIMTTISITDSTSSRRMDIRLVHLAPALTQWTQLSQDAKDIWDKLPDESEAIILDRKPRENSTRPPGRGPPRPPFRNASFTTSVPMITSWLTPMIYALGAKETSMILRRRDPYPLQEHRIPRLPPRTSHRLQYLSTPRDNSIRTCLLLTSARFCRPR
jgi:hypothetical protein